MYNDNDGKITLEPKEVEALAEAARILWQLEELESPVSRTQFDKIKNSTWLPLMRRIVNHAESLNSVSYVMQFMVYLQG